MTVTETNPPAATSIKMGSPPRGFTPRETYIPKPPRSGVAAAAAARLESLESRAYLTAGGLDPSFGNGGKATTDFLAPAEGEAAAVIALPGGQVLAVGQAVTGSERQSMAMTRFRADGTVDTAFGQGGQVVLSFGDNAEATDVARQPDGRLVVAGLLDGQLFVARFSADGAPDATFGQGGRVVLTSGPQRLNARLALAPDGRIVAAAGGLASSGPTPGVAVFRLNADGSPDRTFGAGGSVTTDFGDTDDFAGVVVRPDGRVLVGGSFQASDPTVTGIALTQFTRDGRLDATFAGTGSVRGNVFADGDAVTDVALDRKGRVLLLSSRHNTHLAVARFRADGVFDRSFGARGVADLLPLLTGVEFAYAGRLAVGPGDAVVAVARSVHVKPPDVAGPGAPGMAFVRLTENGAPDTAFSGDGAVDVPLAGDRPAANAVAIAPDGRAVGVGESVLDLTAVRLNADGSSDTSFGGGDGVAAATFTSAAVDIALATMVQADGKYVVAGSSTGRDGRFVALARYRADGTLDPAFGAAGRVRLRLASDADEIRGIAPAAGGKILAVGAVGYGDSGFLVRFNADGSLDTTFGTAGVIRLDAAGDGIRTVAGGKFVVVTRRDAVEVRRYNADGSPDPTFAHGAGLALPGLDGPPIGGARNNLLAVLPDGKLLVGGTDMGRDPRYIYSSIYAVWRVNTNGTIDAAFGDAGKASVAVGGAWISGPATLAVQGDGKILAAGAKLHGIGSSFAIARFNASGSVDTSFGDAGVVITDFPPGLAADAQVPNDYAATMVVQPDGRIIVAGYDDVRATAAFAPHAVEVDFGIARYLPNGSLDNTFGDGGKLTTSFGRDDVPEASFLTPDGKLVVVGAGQTPAGGSDFALARYVLSDPNPLTARLEGGVLKITGTAAADTIRLLVTAGRLSITGVAATFAIGSFSSIQITGAGGNDRIDASAATVPALIDGGAGDDSILGGSAADALQGGSGNDTLFGGAGGDTLRGGAGNDYLNGGPGADQLFGDAGNDQVFAVDAAIDTIDGGLGFDRVKADANDVLRDTEGLLA